MLTYLTSLHPISNLLLGEEVGNFRDLCIERPPYRRGGWSEDKEIGLVVPMIPPELYLLIITWLTEISRLNKFNNVIRAKVRKDSL